MHSLVTFALALLTLSASIAAEWKFEEKPNNPGTRLEVLLGDAPVAALVYGEGQIKPYLHVYGPGGELLTEWSPEQQFPHHRGIFIGWNKIESDLGNFDLWHMRNGGRMEVTRVLKANLKPAASAGEKDPEGQSALLEIEVEWHGGKKDSSGSSLLLTEIRTFYIRKPAMDRTQIDVNFRLKAARDLKLNGDLQHSGIHFRASHLVAARENDTSYLWKPNIPSQGGKVQSTDLKWVRFLFPLGKKWFAATQMNAPKNPVEELSWRNYGRFGFFFKKQLARDQGLDLFYRFVTEPVEAPAGTKHSENELKIHRAAAEKLYSKFLWPN